MERRGNKLKGLPFLGFCMISCIRKLRLYFSMKDGDNPWDSIAGFAFHLDLLLTSIEKLYYLSDEFSSLEDYPKSTIVRSVTIAVFYRHFYSSEVNKDCPDYIYDMFMRPSLYETGN